MSSQQRPLTVEDFWQLKAVTDVQLAPKARTAAYVVGSCDERTGAACSAIWLVNLESGEERRFTTGEQGDSMPRWSPDGEQLAFVSRRNGGEPQVFLIPTSGGEARRMTMMPGGAHSPVWSPDGRRLCVSSEVESDRQKAPEEEAWLRQHSEVLGETARLRVQTTLLSRRDGRGIIDKRSHLFVLDLSRSDEPPRQLTDGDQDDLYAAWSPDGALIAFVSNRTQFAEHNFAADLWTVDVESGEERCLTAGQFGIPAPISWSPDGSTIAFYAHPELVANGYRDTHVWTVARAGGTTTDLAEKLDQACGFGTLVDYVLPGPTAPAWSPDGSTIYFVALERGDQAIFAVSRDTRAVRRVSRGHGVITGVLCSPDGAMLLGLACTPAQPFDVVAVPATGGELRRVTHANRDLSKDVQFALPERIAFCGPQGWEIEGWLYRPAADIRVPYPMILRVHGGPDAAWGHGFSFQAQTLSAAGYASLWVNPRGSLGYGENFALAADWGGDDFRDLLAGVDAVLAAGEVDPARLGISGGSYGGFMTNWALGHSDRFAAGIATNGIANLVSFCGVSDVGALWLENVFPDQFRAQPGTDAGLWQPHLAHSPITYVDEIHAPLLLFQSENDYRCPIEQGEQMFAALRTRDRVVRLIRVPGASHSIMTTAAPHHRYLVWRLSQDWFDTFLAAERLIEGIELVARQVSGSGA